MVFPGIKKYPGDDMCILQSPSHIFNQFETFEMLPTWGNHE